MFEVRLSCSQSSNGRRNKAIYEKSQDKTKTWPLKWKGENYVNGNASAEFVVTQSMDL
jgi:hypothetical protein